MTGNTNILTEINLAWLGLTNLVYWWLMILYILIIIGSKVANHIFIVEPLPEKNKIEPRLSICGNFDFKDKTVIRPPYLNNEIYTGKSTSLYWDSPHDDNLYVSTSFSRILFDNLNNDIKEIKIVMCNFWQCCLSHSYLITGLPTSKILFPYFVEKISVFWVTFPYPLICSSPDSKLNFLFTLVGPIHSQWKL